MSVKGKKLCSFQVCKLLKKNGFKEWCNHCYGISVRHNGEEIDEDEEYELVCNGRKNEIEYVDGGHLYDHFWNNNTEDLGKVYACPTHEETIDWLEREHHIIIVTSPASFSVNGECQSWNYEIWCDDNYEVTDLSDSHSRHEAIEKALLYVFEQNLLTQKMGES